MDQAVARKPENRKPERLMFVIALIVIVGGMITVHQLTRPTGTVQSVTIDDTTSGAVDPVLLERDLEAITFYEDTNILVYVREGEYADNINEETLRYARAEHPELITGDKWTDGWFIITLSIEQGLDGGIGSGQAGTYFGEDIKIESESTQQSVQEHGYDSFRERNWTRGIVNIAEAASGLMARPWYVAPAASIVLPLILLGLLGLYTILIARTRAKISGASSRLGDSTEDVDDLMDQVENIIIGEYAEKIRSTAHDSLRRYTDLLEERGRLQAAPWPLLGLPAHMSRARSFDKEITTFKEDLEIVRDSLVLYERSEGWEQVWGKQLQEIRSELRQIASNSLFARYPEAGGNLLGYAGQVEKELDRIGEMVRKDTSSAAIDTALSELSEIRRVLSSKTSAYLRETSGREGPRGRYIERETAKLARQRRRSASIVGYYGPNYVVLPGDLASGYHSGIKRYEAAQRSSSSGGSGSMTSGYGSSGGGFSGSGSSSRF